MKPCEYCGLTEKGFHMCSVENLISTVREQADRIAFLEQSLEGSNTVALTALDDDPDTFGTRWCSAHDDHETPEQCPAYVAK